MIRNLLKFFLTSAVLLINSTTLNSNPHEASTLDTNSPCISGSRFSQKLLNQAPGIGLFPAKQSSGKQVDLSKTPLPMKVFIFTGQSNMAGKALRSKLPKNYYTPNDRALIWNGKEWARYKPGINFGPELSFFQEMTKKYPEHRIGIIKVASSGKSIDSWNPNLNAAHKSSLYLDILKSIQQAQKQSDFQLSGLIWKQGGKDAKNLEKADSYQKKFIHLIKTLRQDLCAHTLPVYVLTYFNERELTDTNSEARKLLKKFRPHSLPLYLSKARVGSYLKNSQAVFHGKLPTKLDQIHFNHTGQIKLGQMIADAIEKHDQKP